MILKRLFEILLITLITMVLFLLGEGALRVIYPGKITKFRHEPMMYAYTYNPHYLVSVKPNLERDFERTPDDGGAVIRWETNARAFRGRELREHPHFRIMVYGDSNVQARFSILENTFPFQLEGILRNFTHQDIEVINAGIDGFGPDQSYLRFSDEVDEYHPNLVVFVVFADNDFGDLVRNRLFDLDPSGRVVESGRRTSVDQELLPQPFRDFTSNLLLVAGGSKLWRMIDWRHPSQLEILLSLNEQEYKVFAARGPRSFSQFLDSYDADLALFPSGAAGKAKLELMNGILRKSKRLADSRRVKFMVVIEPSASDLTTIGEANFKTFQAYPEYKRTNLTSFVERICVENQIPFVNLWDAFSESDPENLYFRDNIHWNDAGQSVAARETARFIANRFLLQ